jgi:asparagine synthetase B (glutamine-hydrolysing)
MVKIDVKGYVYDERGLKNLWDVYGSKMGKYIRGDFFITVSHYELTTYISDFGGTKCAGYFPRNTTLTVDQDHKTVESFDTISTTSWGHYGPPQGLDRKDSYDDLFKAINNAVAIRYPVNTTPIVALSSGHDSGTIACNLNKQNLDYDVISCWGNENKDILQQRLDLVKGSVKMIDYHSQKDKELVLEELNDLSCSIEATSHYVISKGIQDRVLLSGLGADEMYVSQDYDLMRQFLYSSSKAYEHYNVDIRYPLLDPLVYKEFKLLIPRLQRRFKQPFERYMVHNKYPVNKGPKVGFYIFDDYGKE